MGSDVVWAGPYPAHYSRTFHRALEERWPGTFHFLYVVRPGRSGGRAYERGELPNSVMVVDNPSSVGGSDATLRALRDMNPAALVVNGHSPPALAAAALWGLVRGRKVAYRSDTNLLDIFRNRSVARRAFHRFLGRTLLRSADLLLSSGSRNSLYYCWATGRSAPERAEVRVPLPLDRVRSQGQADAGAGVQEEREQLTFLYLGRLAPEKSVDSLLYAAHELAAFSSRWRILIAGGGEEAEALHRLRLELGVEDRVEFVGRVDSDARYELYRRGDVFVLPSTRESWGLVVNEALSSGLPVVAPRWVGAVADLVIDGYNGVILESNTPEAVSDGMAVFLEDPDLAAEMGTRGPQIVSAGGWNLEGALEQMEVVLAELL